MNKEAKTLKDPQIFVSESCKKLFENMAKQPEFKPLTNKENLFLAILFGYNKKEIGRKPLMADEKNKSGLTRERYLDEKDNAILKAIALSQTDDIEIVTRNRIQDVYSIAEEYANGGYNDLKTFIFKEPGTFIKKFESMLIEIKNEQKEQYSKS